MPTVTYTLNIVNVNPIGNNVWQLEFNPNNTLLEADVLSNPITYLSASSPVILNPFLNNIAGFNNSDYNAIINNATEERLSEWYQQVDYNTAQTVPVNFQQLISGTAYPAAIQDSNYTSYQYSGIRYWGSKNTTDDFNSPLTVTSSIVQTYQNDNLGLTTLGYPSVNRYDIGLLEYNWGGGTYPEIQGAGALSLNQMLLVGGNRDAVGVYGAQQPGFLTASAIEFPIGATPTFFQYTTNVSTITGTKVAAYGFSTPQIANYFIPFNQTGSTFVLENNGVDLDFATATTPIHRTATNPSGFYITSSATVQAQDIVSEISTSLAQGDRWFISAYYQLQGPIQGTLTPWFGTIQSLDTNPNAFVLEKLGTYEIISTSGTNTLTMNLNTGLPSETFGGGGTDNGCLIWKAVQGEYMILSGNTLSGLGKGTLLGSTPSPVIETDLVYITQNYGINPFNT
jgi:hypothetical protein